MDANVSLAPGADDNPLATWLHDTIRRRIFGHSPRGDGRRELFAMRATVAMVAQDRRVTSTLRFDHGAIAVHDGMVGVPDVTICGEFETLLGLAGMPLSRFGRLPLAAPWRQLGLELLGGDVKIYGLTSHPRLVLRVLRLLAAPDGV